MAASPLRFSIHMVSVEEKGASHIDAPPFTLPSLFATAFGPPEAITLDPADVGIPEGTQFKVRDLWSHTDEGTFGADGFTSMVPSTSVTFVKVTF